MVRAGKHPRGRLQGQHANRLLGSESGGDMTGTVAITNFTAGEWSPKLYGRVDIAKYGQACTDMVNMTLIPHGAATKRMGTAFVAEASGENVRLIDFIYNTEQAYILEFSPGRIRFFRNGGLLAGATLYTGYTWEDIRKLNVCQSADVMYLVCPRVQPHKLTRPGADLFALTSVTFTAQPPEWGAGNWPGAVTFHQQRLWFGGAPNNPQKLWASKTGDFENFTIGTEAADGMSLSLVSERVNAIRWLLSQNTLIGGTSGGEWVISGTGEASITSSNIQAKRNSNYGTALVRPLLVGASGLHVSADSRRLRDLSFSVVDDSYLSQDISLLAEHLVRPGIKDIADCQNPDSIIWCVMQNGSLVGCTYLRSQEVIAWHRHETDGTVLSVACVPGNGYTETWLAVKRQNGVFIERMAAPWDGNSSNEADCWYLDAALLYEGKPVSSLSGLGHLEGQEVSVLADGAGHPPRMVKNGGISLTVPANRVLVGLPYAWKLAPMRLEGLSPRGTMQGKKARIVEVMARVYKTLGLHYAWVGQADEPYLLPMREVDMPMDAVPTPFSGDVTLPMPGGWDSDTRVVFSGQGPFPATIIMMAVSAVVNG